MAAMMMRQKVAGAIAGERRSAVAPKMGRAATAPVVVASANASAFKGAAVTARVKASTRAARVQSRRTAVLTQAKIGDSLAEFLVEATPDPKLRHVMMSMAEATRTIAHKVRTASCAGTACVNSFGDEQLAVDMVADKLLFEALKYSHVCKLACSEEVPEPVDMGGEGFCVAFDPLDGSSIVDTNFAVGTIFGVWPGDKLTNITGREQVAAGMGIYGPRTVFCIALKDAPGCHEFLLMDDGKWMHVKETTHIGGQDVRPRQPARHLRQPRLRAPDQLLPGREVHPALHRRHRARLVPDHCQGEGCVHQLDLAHHQGQAPHPVRGCSPGPAGIEKAGGASSCDGKAVSALDIPILVCDQRTQICYGSIGEVRRFEEYMYGTSPRFSEKVVA
uniref:Sedoheptulose-1,7-biphosphatase n=1 Tax=Chlamydomonas reinhardtii TaxID=3055 RepID=O23780_CHLRE|nr:sedoheptulose-1,7-biphosphatase [Chlamydomonas reinhardtii]